MSRLFLCGGLMLDAVAGLMSIPGVSEACSWTTAHTWLVGGALTAMPAIYKVAVHHFGIVLTKAPEIPALERLPLSSR